MFLASQISEGESEHHPLVLYGHKGEEVQSQEGGEGSELNPSCTLRE